MTDDLGNMLEQAPTNGEFAVRIEPGSSVLNPNSPPCAGVGNADTRVLLVSSMFSNTVVANLCTNALAGDHITAALDAAVRATKDGHLFELVGRTDMQALYDQSPERGATAWLRLPYEPTPIAVTTTDGLALLFVLSGDEDSRLRQIVIAYLAEIGPSRVHGLSTMALVRLQNAADGHADVLTHFTTTPDALTKLRLWFHLGKGLLGLICDRRVDVRRESVPAKVNATRLKRGRPVLPDYWKVEPGDYVTTLSQPSPGRRDPKGGTHASPRPHDRRAHARRLPGNAIAWIRSCHVGATRGHLRARSFYELKNVNPGAKR